MLESKNFVLSKKEYQMAVELTEQFLKKINTNQTEFVFNIDDSYIKRMRLPLYELYLKNILTEEEKFPYEKLREFKDLISKENDVLDVFI